MAKGDHRYRRRALGSTNGGYARPRVQIGFDETDMAEIRKLAKANKRSFAAEVRTLVNEALYLRLRIQRPVT